MNAKRSKIADKAAEEVAAELARRLDDRGRAEVAEVPEVKRMEKPATVTDPESDAETDLWDDVPV